MISQLFYFQTQTALLTLGFGSGFSFWKQFSICDQRSDLCQDLTQVEVADSSHWCRSIWKPDRMLRYIRERCKSGFSTEGSREEGSTFTHKLEAESWNMYECMYEVWSRKLKYVIERQRKHWKTELIMIYVFVYEIAM